VKTLGREIFLLVDSSVESSRELEGQDSSGVFEGLQKSSRPTSFSKTPLGKALALPSRLFKLLFGLFKDL
jgi:hypothetical protein